MTVIGKMLILEEILEDSASNGGAHNSNDTIVTSSQMAEVVDRVLVGSREIEVRYQEAIRDTNNFSNPPTVTQVQAVIDTVNLDLSGLFKNQGSFNSDYIKAWDVSRVTNMSEMFQEASSFNQDISDWVVKNVTNMGKMFSGADGFNQDISDWDVSSVTNMGKMFSGADGFNQDIGNWDVSSATNMSYMFNFAKSFNQNLDNWSVANVTDMSYMFDQTRVFNGLIGSWDVGRVTNMSNMFQDTRSFNQDIGNWDVSRVTNMRSMFHDAQLFNQDISRWDISALQNAKDMFLSSNMSVDNYDRLLAGWATLNTAAGETAINTNVVFGGMNYTDATSHNHLTTLYGWDIDGGSPSNAVTVGTNAAETLDQSASATDKIIHGLDGNDTLIGGAGGDELVGGGGDDVLTGGAGADHFVFRFYGSMTGDTAETGHDTITDFDPAEGDIIEFRGPIFNRFNDILTSTSQDGDDVVIALDGHNSVRLAGTDLTEFRPSNFSYNVPPRIGDTTGSVAEDGTLVTSGAIDIDDPGASVDSDFTWVIGAEASFGSATIDGSGNWSYALDNDAAAVQAVRLNETLIDNFSVHIQDSAGNVGLTTVSISITGANEAAVIGGDITGAVARDDVTRQSGLLTSSDVDGSDNTFISGAVIGNYGALSIFENGIWSYSLISNTFVNSLKDGERLIETITVASEDGTAQTITIEIRGRSEVNLNATDGDDALIGTNFGEYIQAMAGNDTVFGYGGDDTILGDVISVWQSEGKDWIDGGSGNDIIQGGHGNDWIIGGEGNDLISADIGQDTIFGGLGNDTLDGGNDSDSLSGQGGIDTFLVSTTAAGHDTITDFDPVSGEIIKFGGHIFNRFSDILASAASDNSDVVITVDANNSLRLLNTDLGDLHHSNFFYGIPRRIGDTTGSVIEDSTLVTIGAIDIDDPGASLDTDFTWMVTDNGPHYGTATVDGNGDWTYTLDNNAVAVQAVHENETLADTFQVSIEDATGNIAHTSVTITITGTNEAAMISGNTDGIVGRDDVDTTVGTLTSSDVDGNDNVFLAETVQSTYGSLIIDAAGHWKYTLDHNNTAVLGLGTSDTLQGVVSVKAEDSTTQDITITIKGRSDVNLITSAENDTLFGTDLDDNISSRKGNDLVFGYEGNDTLNGGFGNDTIYGNIGNDTIQGSYGKDMIDGGAGDDFIEGNRNYDILFGGTGDDTLVSGDGNDTIFGGSGNDFLYGEVGNDSLNGGDGNDILDGGVRSNDSLFGDYGNDSLNGGEGNDILYGGDGGNDTLDGYFGDDTIFGEAGNNRLLGHAGNDHIEGGDGDDTVNGGAGDDYVLGNGGDDELAGGNNNDTLHGGEGHDVIKGNAGDDYLTGGATGNDTIEGGTGHDTVHGGTAGRNLLSGGADNDKIIGGASIDTIDGGDGADTIYGNGGDDILTGGSGADTFVFAANTAKDVITDFDYSAGDVIDLSDAGTGYSSINDISGNALDVGTQGLWINLGDGNTLFLRDHTLADLNNFPQDSFVF